MKRTGVHIVLLIGIVIVLNLISEQWYFRIDFTEDNRYSLSDATRNILDSLDQPLSVTAYFSENLPPNIKKNRDLFEEYLIEYNRLSGNNVMYEFLNPTKNEELEKKAQEAGIQPVMINVREKDQVKQQKAYMGAILKYGDQKEVIPFLDPQVPIEYALSTSIKKMSVSEKPGVAILQGHGEPELKKMYQAVSELQVLNNVQTYKINPGQPIPGRFRTVAIIRPTDSFPDAHLRQLDEFLERGGNLFIALNRVDADMETLMGSVVNTGLEKWLANKGLEVKKQFVTDAQAGNIRVQRQQGMFQFATNVKFPYIPVVTNFADHPVTKGIENVIFKFISPVHYVGQDSSAFTPLLYSSKNSGTASTPTRFDVNKQWQKKDFLMDKQILGGVLSDTSNTGNPYKILLIADGDFPVNDRNYQRRQMQQGNLNLMVNAVDWLNDDTGLIALRTKGVDYRPLDELKDGKKTFLKYLNFLLPVIILVGYGLVRMQINNRKRVKRMEESYE
ncbi:MAG: GldG family protein [Bacteroidales bacterium]